MENGWLWSFEYTFMFWWALQTLLSSFSSVMFSIIPLDPLFLILSLPSSCSSWISTRVPNRSSSSSTPSSLLRSPAWVWLPDSLSRGTFEPSSENWNPTLFPPPVCIPHAAHTVQLLQPGDPSWVNVASFWKSTFLGSPTLKLRNTGETNSNWFCFEWNGQFFFFFFWQTLPLRAAWTEEPQ